MEAVKMSRSLFLVSLIASSIGLGLGGLLSACSGGDDEESGGGGCIPNESKECTCADGSKSVKSCKADGTWGECLNCTGGEAATGGGGDGGTGGGPEAGTGGSAGGPEAGTGGGAAGEPAVDGGTEDAGPPDLGPNPDPTRPRPEFIPESTGPCPGFAEGDGCHSDFISLICTFTPTGYPEEIPARNARVWIGPQAFAQEASLVIYWHYFTGSPSLALNDHDGFGQSGVDQIVNDGGILVAPFKDDRIGPGDANNPRAEDIPWQKFLGVGPDWDLWVMDEIVACAIERVGVDVRRIYSTGNHAGGLWCGQTAHMRNGYLASVACLAGGQLGEPAMQDPYNKYPAFLSYAGAGDWYIVSFLEAQTAFKQRLNENGQFAALCDSQAGGHLGTAAWQFLKEHPYGVTPEPYQGGLPASMLGWCVP
jgi:hypothetical protein